MIYGAENDHVKICCLCGLKDGERAEVIISVWMKAEEIQKYGKLFRKSLKAWNLPPETENRDAKIKGQRIFIFGKAPVFKGATDVLLLSGVRKGKRGRGAAGKIAVFGLLKRNGRVYTAVIPNAWTETLLPIIKEQVEPDSIVYTDTYSAYNALDVSGFHHHHRINHSQQFAKQNNYINGIENWGNQAKRHLRRFNGIKQDYFYWFLKKCEWRFNGGNHKQLLTELTSWVKQAKR